MICYKDQAFCGSDCKNKDCFRFFGEEQDRKAREWWGSDGAPVAFIDFSKICKEYTP